MRGVPLLTENGLELSFRIPSIHRWVSFIWKITLDSEHPMLKEKRIIPSIWGGIKRFEHFQRGEYFLMVIVHSISFCELILCPVLRLLSPGWIKTRLYSVISSYGYSFNTSRLIYICRTTFILVFSQRTILLTHASEQTCALKTSAEKNKRPASLLEKERLLRSFYFCFSNNSQSCCCCFLFVCLFVFCFVFFCFVFFIFHYIALFSFCTQNFPFHSLSSRERHLPAGGSDLKTIDSLPVNNCGVELDLTEASKTNH